MGDSEYTPKSPQFNFFPRPQTEQLPRLPQPLLFPLNPRGYSFSEEGHSSHLQLSQHHLLPQNPSMLQQQQQKHSATEYSLQAPNPQQPFLHSHVSSQYPGKPQNLVQPQEFQPSPYYRADPAAPTIQEQRPPRLDTFLLNAMPPKQSAAAAASQSITVAAEAEVEPSPVRTKFPTARIKRIMQADEEVGKVAQQTPIAVGKALEMFMVQLVTKSAEVAREKNSKRVSAQMLRHVVETNDQWDFLRDIVSKVGNEEKSCKKERAASSKQESESSDEAPDTPVEKKKGKGGRKKKAV